MFLGKPAAVASSQTMTTWSGFWYGSGRSSTVCTSEKMVVLAPDAERQRADRRDREDRCLSQQAQGVSQVGKEIHGALDGWQWAPVGAAPRPRIFSARAAAARETG